MRFWEMYSWPVQIINISFFVHPMVGFMPYYKANDKLAEIMWHYSPAPSYSIKTILL